MSAGLDHSGGQSTPAIRAVPAAVPRLDLESEGRGAGRVREEVRPIVEEATPNPCALRNVICMVLGESYRKFDTVCNFNRTKQQSARAFIRSLAVAVQCEGGV